MLTVQVSHASNDDWEGKNTVLRKALLRAVERLGLNRSELSAIIGVSEVLAITAQKGELAVLLLRLYRSLDMLFRGNQSQCQLWVRSFNTHLGGIPVELIQTISGLTSVIIYLDVICSQII